MCIPHRMNGPHRCRGMPERRGYVGCGMAEHTHTHIVSCTCARAKTQNVCTHLFTVLCHQLIANTLYMQEFLHNSTNSLKTPLNMHAYYVHTMYVHYDTCQGLFQHITSGGEAIGSVGMKGGPLKQLSGILYSPLLLLSLHAWPKFNM